ncbi:MAG: arsenic efflux protein [Bacilli bacterium]|nr:arsenic efflux protein [Bacilli bacterium]
MIHIIEHSILDTIKIIPFLFVAFLFIEYIEHKIKNKKILTKVGRLGPLFGGILGLVPQCGFSIMATNLYITRIITLGTLISIYLTTSDEMLIILLSSNISVNEIIKILSIKFIIGIVCGFIIDLIIKPSKNNNYEICEKDSCGCSKGIFKSSIEHTIRITLFVLIVTLILNTMFHYLDTTIISKIFMKDSIFSPLLSSLIGLIPNCASSVILTELYVNNIINLGGLIGGLLTGSGVALIILFKSSHDKKEAFRIFGLLYIIGIMSGIMINIIGKIC